MTAGWRQEQWHLERNGVRLAWNESGPGVPILLIMDDRYSSAMWYPALETLGERCRLIWFDNQGRRESGARRRICVLNRSGGRTRNTVQTPALRSSNQKSECPSTAASR